MKFLSALIISIIFNSAVLYSNIVINELYYDPIGSDSGFEWIELYNPTEESINLKGWKIEKAGSEFTLCYLFKDNIIIHSRDFLLIGEDKVSSADIITELSFQNGGSSTDGVRIVSPQGDYTDTILYDSPNENNLFDDTGTIGTDFAPDVSSGHSLARIQDGVDTNSSSDWFDCEQPTPGDTNIMPIDLSIKRFYPLLEDGMITLFTLIQNLSTTNVDNFVANVEFYMNQEFIVSKSIPFITSGDSVLISCEISSISTGYFIFDAKLNLNNDNNLENNESACSFLYGPSPFIFNELMIKPENEDNEWVEIFKRNNVDNLVDNLYIQDRTSGKIHLFGDINDYLVVCKDKNLFIQAYPQADTSKIIESSSWTSLNNTTENLYLKDIYGTVLDTLYYNAYHLSKNISYERVNPYSDENIQWLECIDENGATPTFANSNLPKNRNLVITFLDLTIENDKIKHSLKIYNNGLTNIYETDFNCFIKKDEQDFIQIYSDNLTLNDTLYYSFETEKYFNGYYTFKYEISNDDNPKDNTVFSFYNDGSLPFVINEIMYNPSEDEPEWIEIHKNIQLAEEDSFFIKIGNDSYYLNMPAEEYFLITSDLEDAEFLKNKYNLSNLPLIGLSSLSNNGKDLYLYDKIGNLIEKFFYEPEWNNKTKGVSIERINPAIKADADNFGPCLNNCTPEKENTLFVQIIPSKNHFSLSPNPFSPYNSEHTIISYELSEPINKLTVKVFDLKGREVSKIRKNELAASSGSFVWDGKDKSGKILPIGVYIVYFRAIAKSKLFEDTKTIVIKK